MNHMAWPPHTRFQPTGTPMDDFGMTRLTALLTRTIKATSEKCFINEHLLVQFQSIHIKAH